MGTDRERQTIDSPTAWFCALEVAHQRGDYEAAAEALRQLRRLGVEVRMRPTPARVARKEVRHDG